MRKRSNPKIRLRKSILIGSFPNKTALALDQEKGTVIELFGVHAEVAGILGIQMKGTTKEKLLSALKERSGEIPNDLALLTILRELAACGLLDGAKAFLKTGSRPKRQTPGKAKRSLASQSLLLGATLGIGMLWVPEPAHGGFLTVPGGSCTSPGCTYSNPGGSCNFSQLIGCLNVTGVGLVCNSFIETCNDSSGHTVEYCIPQNACT